MKIREFKTPAEIKAVAAYFPEFSNVEYFALEYRKVFGTYFMEVCFRPGSNFYSVVRMVDVEDDFAAILENLEV